MFSFFILALQFLGVAIFNHSKTVELGAVSIDDN
jgi:hypothetical protein